MYLGRQVGQSRDIISIFLGNANLPIGAPQIVNRMIAVFLKCSPQLARREMRYDVSRKQKARIPVPHLPLEGKVALVTGAAKRIGRSVALRLAEEGSDVIVNYRGSKAEADQVVAQIAASGRRAAAIQADVAKKIDVTALFAAVTKEFGRLDILVNNAGMFFPAKFEELTEEQWDRMLNANLKSQFLCCQAAAPMLRASGQGRIINFASLGGLLAWPAYTHYCVSKAGVIMLTRCLARALAPEITVNAIAPGTISFAGDAPEIAEDFIRRAPLARTGTAKDIDDAVVFLAESAFVTGQVIVVDGGRSLA
jgi:NAD(P)-dependent dehydrogenase (short-subunit alcohol dehydrogenase family)